MKNKTIIIGIITCISAVVGIKETSSELNANLGSWAASHVTSNNHVINGAAGVGGYVGAMAGAYAGAWLGAQIGCVGGPAGAVIGGIVGAGAGAL
ncbi:hypothetical protein [Aquirufa aurantiipilula]|uniref:hypothetical protein n=1 Tax=Aquirufa aurantiipilula TaxID=2696561 RepID=UPI001CAA7D44|nr:hypothetical protein [Aquirufa aurantiipilula]MBZ1327218.1 hypothetical protein [Aquirufa aurantiipilula]